MEHIKIDRTIDPHEVCIRCLFRPYDKKGKDKLKHDSLLPPSDSNDVSMIRLKYADDNILMQHGLSIEKDDKKLWGFAHITQVIVDSVNQWAQSEASKLDNIGVNGIHAEIVASPMRTPSEYVEENEEVWLDDQNLYCPMHCDLKYSEKATSEVKTRLRQYASQLVSRLKYYIQDDNGEIKKVVQEEAFIANNK